MRWVPQQPSSVRHLQAKVSIWHISAKANSVSHSLVPVENAIWCETHSKHLSWTNFQKKSMFRKFSGSLGKEYALLTGTSEGDTEVVLAEMCQIDTFACKCRTLLGCWGTRCSCLREIFQCSCISPLQGRILLFDTSVHALMNESA